MPKADTKLQPLISVAEGKPVGALAEGQPVDASAFGLFTGQPVAVDGYFGPQTRQALAGFLAARKIEMTTVLESRSGCCGCRCG